MRKKEILFAGNNPVSDCFQQKKVNPVGGFFRYVGLTEKSNEEH